MAHWGKVMSEKIRKKVREKIIKNLQNDCCDPLIIEKRQIKQQPSKSANTTVISFSPPLPTALKK